MSAPRTTWYVWAAEPWTVARRDVDPDGGTERWSLLGPLQEAFPALACLGAAGHEFDDGPGAVSGAYQVGRNELVLEVTASRWVPDDPRPPGLDPEHRAVRLDLVTGHITEYPAGFGRGDYVEGWRRYSVADHVHWDVVNLVTGESITHEWDAAVFRTPAGGTVALPEGGGVRPTLGIVDGRLFVRQRQWEYRIFDLDNLTTDDVIHARPPDSGPGSVPDGFRQAWSTTSGPEAWLERRPAGEFSRAMLEAINTAAMGSGTRATELLAVMNAQSGLRTTAYHPAGRYGLLQLTADQLHAAGWTGSPDDYLAAGVDQLPAIRAHLAGLGLPAGVSETELWLALLVPGSDPSGLTPGTVIAAPGGPRSALFTSHGVADLDDDGRLTVEDLRRYLGRLHDDPRLVELTERTNQLAARVPAWRTRASTRAEVVADAVRLGLTVQHVMGSGHDRVTGISELEDSLVHLTNPVVVTYGEV